MEQAIARPIWLLAFEWVRAPSPAVRFGIKWGAAMVVALWLAHAYGQPQPAWIVITIAFVMQPVSGASALKGLNRILGTVVAGLSAVALFGLFSQDPALMMASVFTTTSFGEERPAVNRSDEAAWAQNRRVEFVISRGERNAGPQRVTIDELPLDDGAVPEPRR